MNKVLNKIRPSLRRIDPLVYYVTLAFAMFNLYTGIVFFSWDPPVKFNIILPAISLRDWGIIFAIAGLGLFYGLIRNNWPLLKYWMIFGLFIKMVWLIGLVFRLNNGGTTFFVGCWALIAAVQLLAVVYFLPGERHDGRSA